MIIGAVLLLSITLSADTLILRDGRCVQGELLSVHNGIVEFRGQDSRGNVIRVDRDQVVGIEFGRIERNEPQYGRNPQSNGPEGRPRGMREKQLMVPAATAWTDTGIDINAGQSVYFEAAGEIRWGGNRRAGPAGEQNSPNNPARPMPNRPGASLIGKVGNNSNDLFYVGDDRGAIRVRGSGRLFLGINDDGLADNTGYFRVIVYY
jgi:hypothetical protein